ncbi:alpha/beta hydrolase family protein [Allorhodopirellula heiligendammensis]|uniref:Alpha/beta hydrolase family protein n=1 Tax=Allorhodopirellula heiligendammensis TaxID=2714739 RepID=A0A5C6BGC9_9BACT|nr:prolyl oligopeptidase family serine peptidase [Allorhodopirellula heiligendammensis]TWU10762.1 Alpha/beta hydrolase family protein [Allorhodopirellula heiligendammensis]
MSDKIMVQCSHCDKRLRATPAAQARRARCPACQTVLTIPATTDTPLSINRESAPTHPQGSESNPQSSGQTSRMPRPVVAATEQEPVPAVPPASDPLDFDHFSDNPYLHSAPIRTIPPTSNRLATASSETNKNLVPAWLMVGLAGGGIAAAALFVGGAVALWSVLSITTSVAAPSETLAAPSGSSGVASPTTPQHALPPARAIDPAKLGYVDLPPLGAEEETFPSGVTSYFVRLSGSADKPAGRMQMRIYLPPGEHGMGALPCVLVAPAGTPLLHGVDLDQNTDYHDETLPYAEAGMVVIAYSLDGPVSEAAQQNEQILMGELATQFPRFRDAGGGVANGRMAVQYALQQLPMVDSERINCAGHSSAATVALLLAAAEPKINRVAAFAAAYDLESRMADVVSNPSIQQLLPGVGAFVMKTSPINVTHSIECPVLVFHARDDTNVPIGDAEKFIAKLRRSNKEVDPIIVTSGGHYQSMIDQGIPAAIKFFSSSD